MPGRGMAEALYACLPTPDAEVAPLWPHLVQRARCRSRSLDVSAPHRIINGTRAIGAWCKHFFAINPGPAVAALKLSKGWTWPRRLPLGGRAAAISQPPRH